jgi:hypothetical protein
MAELYPRAAKQAPMAGVVRSEANPSGGAPSYGLRTYGSRDSLPTLRVLDQYNMSLWPGACRAAQTFRFALALCRPQFSRLQF